MGQRSKGSVLVDSLLPAFPTKKCQGLEKGAFRLVQLPMKLGWHLGGLDEGGGAPLLVSYS